MDVEVEGMNQNMTSIIFEGSDCSNSSKSCNSDMSLFFQLPNSRTQKAGNMY